MHSIAAWPAAEQAERDNGFPGERPRVVIIGGGISGLSAAYQVTRLAPEAEVVLLERAGRLGGKIITERVDGFVVEGGPEALLVAKPPAMALCQSLGLTARLMGPNPTARQSFILRGGRLQPLPDGLSGLLPTRIWPLVTTRLLSPLGKARMALDLLVPRRRDDAHDEESVAAFIERRLGREAYRWLIDPLVAGIYSGDGRRLSMAATFPQVQALEREHGGLIRGMLAARKNAGSRASGPRTAPFQTPRGGLGELVETLAATLQADGVGIATDAGASGITAEGAGYRVSLQNGGALRADAVVCAAPAPDAAEMLAGLDGELAAHLRAIPHASTAVVALAFVNQTIPRPLQGSGYLTPRAEQRAVKACTWVSAKWAGRAPEGTTLIRVSLGGAGQDEIAAASDERLVALAREEMRDIFGIKAPPLWARIFRWPRAMPQYETGHLARIAAIEERLTAHPGLALAGNAYRGAGLAECVQSGEQAAQRILAFLTTRTARQVGTVDTSRLALAKE